MSVEYSEKYLRRWRLKQLKRLIILLSVAVFVMFNRGQNFLVVQFLWSCLIMQEHNLPVNALYMHTEWSAVQAGGSLARLTLSLAAGYVLCILCEAIWAPVDMTEAQFAEDCIAAKRRLNLVYRTHQNALESMTAINAGEDHLAELTKLHEILVKIRLEADAITVKRSAKVAKSQTLSGEDLFTAGANKSRLSTKAGRRWRKPTPPQF